MPGAYSKFMIEDILRQDNAKKQQQQNYIEQEWKSRFDGPLKRKRLPGSDASRNKELPTEMFAGINHRCLSAAEVSTGQYSTGWFTIFS